MNTQSLILSSVLIGIPVFISYKEKLSMEKDILISIVRAIIQLVIAGYLLEFFFEVDNKFITVILLLIMIINASYNAGKKFGKLKKAVFISCIAMIIGTGVTLSVLILSGSLEFKPQDIIPTGGMIVSNSMVAIGLAYRNLNNEFNDKKMEVEIKLALGADIREASHDILKESIKTGLVPVIDSAKTLGIVSLPGMMTGLILGGASPIVAIKYQIMVTFMILSSAAISTLICVYMGYKSFFNKRMQINLIL
ncbi:MULTISPECIES: ABC transporter permease [Clostridium]|jgi:putative ABC transport system permease protein|uniref:Iron export ABC transporter permease subunit FetB n=1 Tax=Clostridium butyricum TaxID=1492 RepID=A0AAP9REM6_CLOBU|nr:MULTISPECIES: iron export ABC transporter permease subunit FetB [Clostridium]MDU4855530.1 iron export ABC transporter permease subunit FetB [Clostridioides difficile]ALP90625.1 hypothetical protein ATN24_10920 [Clostridium butyricum]ALS17131.1 hypothetical protein ATD26_09725 [Clostridium butyricum]ANF14248.1 hypothetical protein AZ909_09370 [Clostridium butyricum]AOR94313.1 iron export ABC transporter permease subunit FetB [Clostridium butyricum]